MVTRTKKQVIPRLQDLFIRCPVCKKGSTNLSYFGTAYCESCGQTWNIWGDPIEDTEWLKFV